MSVAGVDRLALDLLGSDVAEGADELAGRGQAADRRGVLGQTEVREVGVVRGSGEGRDEEHVGRLDVTVDELVPVRGLQRTRDWGGHRRGSSTRAGPPCEERPKILALDVAHGDVQQALRLAAS